MAITSEILNKYSIVDSDENGNGTLLCAVKWNGREPKGYDIRKYIKEQDQVFKGITLTYDGFEQMVCDAIEKGLVSKESVLKAVKKFESNLFDQSDFQQMFNNVKTESSDYKRDKYGVLYDENNRLVVSCNLK